MTEDQARQLLADLLDRFSTGSILHLLAEVLREAAAAGSNGDAEPLRDALGTLHVVGVGLDAVWPGGGR